MIRPGRHPQGMNLRMTAPVQGYLPDNIDGRLLGLDSDNSSDFASGTMTPVGAIKLAPPNSKTV
jgi:hypothetical protein